MPIVWTIVVYTKEREKKNYLTIQHTLPTGEFNASVPSCRSHPGGKFSCGELIDEAAEDSNDEELELDPSSCGGLDLVRFLTGTAYMSSFSWPVMCGMEFVLLYGDCASGNVDGGVGFS